MAATFPSHASAGYLLQLPVHERNHPAEGRLVALSPRQQQLGDPGGMGRHAAILTADVFGPVHLLSAVSRLSMQEEETEMASTARCLVAGLAVTVTLLGGGQALAAEDGEVRIVIHVDNYARIPGADLGPAEAEVTRIYATAGVRIVWATRGDHADEPGLHVRVQLLSRDMAMRRIMAETVDDTVVGQAAREAATVYIFTHRIVNLALRHSDDFRRVLGLVIAHEAGHLVLPIYSHTDRGIMRPNIGVRSKSFHDFTTEQGVAIRKMILGASRPHAGQITAAGRQD
jgi:hypothetical protein